MSIVREILDQCPPNYTLFEERNGIIRTKNVVQKTAELADHHLVKAVDFNIDGTDYGVITRVVARGAFLDPTDVGLSTASGGTATYGAYKLDNYSDWGATNGIKKTQAQADAIINQIANGDPKTPAGWASDPMAQTYGAIWRIYGPTVRRWHMEDSNLFWVDLGRNAGTDRQHRIEQFEIQLFPVHWPVGTIIDQTIQIFQMAEEDYEIAPGHVPPTASGDAVVAANLRTLADSQFWRPLTSEEVLGLGTNVIGPDKFELGKPTTLRFLKFVCGQPSHHPIEPGTMYSGSAYSIIAMAGLRIYTSRDIIQEAKLGFTPPFDTDAMRELAKRLRPRTLFLEENPYIDTTNAAKAFASQELQERYTEFEPIAINAVAPTVDLWDTVTWTNPETGVTGAYLVQAIQYGQMASTYLQIVDYRYFQDA
jgi:hypothetical protein